MPVSVDAKDKLVTVEGLGVVVGKDIHGDDIATTYAKDTEVTQSKRGLMSANDKVKLDGIAAGAQVNPGNATTSAAGLMSAADKTKLNGIAAGAQVNPGNATTSAAGLMSAADKSKLDGIAAGAQVNPGNATQSAAGLMSAADKTIVDYMFASTKGQALDANTNFNNVTTPGVYATWNSYINAPLTGAIYGYLLVLKHGGNYFQCWYNWTGNQCAMRGYSNNAWQPWSYLYGSTNQTYTINYNSNIVSACTVKNCIVRNGWAYVDLRFLKFKSKADSQMGALTGLPQAKYQVDIIFGGTDSGATAAIRNAGDTAWIEAGGTTMNVHTGNTYNYDHWCSFSYPVA